MHGARAPYPDNPPRTPVGSVAWQASPEACRLLLLQQALPDQPDNLRVAQ